MQTSCRLIPSAKAAPQLRQYLYFCATKASNLSTCQIQKLAGARLAICRGTAVRAQAVGPADFFFEKEGGPKEKGGGLLLSLEQASLQVDLGRRIFGRRSRV